MNVRRNHPAQSALMGRYFWQRHVAPGLAELTERYPRLNIELTLTDDFIDPHRDAADLIFRIGMLTDSTFHARIFGQQRYHLAASPAYLRKHGVPDDPPAERSSMSGLSRFVRA
jgi:DNA-binding transcriptional LysR family regulator